MNVSWLSSDAAGLLADVVMLVHAAFVLWVVAGGMAVHARPVLALAHLPAAAWGVWIQWSGGLCPLTPLENALRHRAGEGGYTGGFIEHYLEPLLYPAGLTRDLQGLLGAGVLLLNLVVYGVLWTRWRRRRRPGGPHGT